MQNKLIQSVQKHTNYYLQITDYNNEVHSHIVLYSLGTGTQGIVGGQTRGYFLVAYKK